MASPLYDTSFTLHRLSPLHFSTKSSLLTGEALLLHSRRFANTLKGEVVRGVQVGDIETEGLARAGSFKACHWTLLIADGSSEELVTSPPRDGTTNGIRMELEYEKNRYQGLLLRAADSSHDSISDHADTEVHLPLMLTRMPNALREVLFDYLATTFDTRVECLRLSSNFMANTLEHFIEDVASTSQEDLQDIVKEIHLSLGFRTPISPNLRTLEITIQREDLLGFVARGEKLTPSTLITASGRKQSGRPPNSGPFLLGLQKYLEAHMALTMNHEDVVISRIACGAFALGREGRVKIFAPINSQDEEDTLPSHQLAVDGLVKSLLDEALGSLSGGSSG